MNTPSFPLDCAASGRRNPAPPKSGTGGLSGLAGMPALEAFAPAPRLPALEDQPLFQGIPDLFRVPFPDGPNLDGALSPSALPAAPGLFSIQAGPAANSADAEARQGTRARVRPAVWDGLSSALAAPARWTRPLAARVPAFGTRDAPRETPVSRPPGSARPAFPALGGPVSELERAMLDSDRVQTDFLAIAAGFLDAAGADHRARLPSLAAARPEPSGFQRPGAAVRVPVSEPARAPHASEPARRVPAAPPEPSAARVPGAEAAPPPDAPDLETAAQAALFDPADASLFSTLAAAAKRNPPRTSAAKRAEQPDFGRAAGPVSGETPPLAVTLELDGERIAETLLERIKRNQWREAVRR